MRRLGGDIEDGAPPLELADTNGLSAPDADPVASSRRTLFLLLSVIGTQDITIGGADLPPSDGLLDERAHVSRRQDRRGALQGS